MFHVRIIYNILKRLPNPVLVFVLRIMAADWIYKLKISNTAMLYLVTFFLPGINRHPDKGYRLINLYDAYAPTFSATHDENEVARWGEELGFKILSFTSHRLGFVGEKFAQKDK